MILNPFVLKDIKYNPLKDFAPVAIIGNWTSVMAVSPNTKIKNLNEFITLVKNNPGKFNYASTGIGSRQHVNMEALLDRMSLKMTHVPYSGAGSMIPDLITGADITVALNGAGVVRGLIDSGQLTAIATSGPQGKEFFPNTPDINTLAKDLEFYGWFAVFAPVGTPVEIINYLNKEINAAMLDKETTKLLHESGIVPRPGSVLDAESALQKDYARYEKFLNKLNIIAN
jgi:tripartite-type tricarboxylate transporter receptor subunit TctC